MTEPTYMPTDPTMIMSAAQMQEWAFAWFQSQIDLGRTFEDVSAQFEQARPVINSLLSAQIAVMQATLAVAKVQKPGP